MYRGSLFERLTPSLNPGLYESNEEALYTSIALNLSRIFSTNAGSAEIGEDYGRPDLDNINYSLYESIKSIEENSKQTINKYEPRLLKAFVKVRKEPLNKHQMSIVIEGFVLINKEMKKISFQANLFKNGGVEIKRYEV